MIVLAPLRRAAGALGLVLAACRSAVGGDPEGLDQVNAKFAEWRGTGITTYEFVVRNTCFCIHGGAEVRVAVISGSVASAILLASGDPVPAEFATPFRSFDGLFDLLVDAHRRRAARLDVEYDGLYAYPISAYIDYSANTADEEFGWEIVSFTPQR